VSPRIPLLAVLAAAAVLAGCFESTKPLSPAGLVPYDNAVSGQWTCVPDPPLRPQDKATLTIRATDQHQFDATWLDGDKTSRYAAGLEDRRDVVINVLEVAPGAKDGSSCATSARARSCT